MAFKQPVVLPPNKQWSQPNTGFLFGSLYSTRNVNLEVPGVLSLSRRARYIGREDTSGSSFDYLLSIVYDGRALTGATKYYLVSSDKIYTLNTDLTSFAIDGTASTPSLSIASSDGIIWNDGLYVTTASNMSKLVSSTWTNSLLSLTNGIPHPLCVSTINNYLLIGDGNLLKKRTTGGTDSTALTLPSDYRIQWIRSDNARVLIGTRNMGGGTAAVFEWDESAAAATNKYDLESNWSLSGTFRNTDFFTICTDGRLMKFNGGGFAEAGRLPIFKTLSGDWVNNFALGSVAQRGMGVIGGRINMFMNGRVADTLDSSNYYENMLSGIWEFDESTGFNHKYGVSFSQTGEDYCQGELSGGVGAIAPIFIDPITGGPAITVGTTLLYGARLTKGATDYYTVGSVINDTNRGEFETTRVETVGIADDSLKLWVKFRGVWTSSDKIIFKFKDKVKVGIPFAATNTWTSTTTFTSTNAGWANAAVGDEVTSLLGNGAGAAAQITAITDNAGTYTITLDEAIPNVSNAETGRVICDNYKKLETTITNSDTRPYKDIPIQQTDPSDWVQIKGELRGSSYVTIEELQLVNGSHVIATS